MNAFQTQSLFEKIIDSDGVIPPQERAYFEQRLRNRVLALLLERFADAQKVAYPVVPGSARCGMRGGMSRREGGEGAADGEGAIADRVPTSLP
jgi:hypothetical protein